HIDAVERIPRMRDERFLLFQPVESIEIENHEAVEVGVPQPIAGTNAVPAAGADGEWLTIDGMEAEGRSRIDHGRAASRYHNSHLAGVVVLRRVGEVGLKVGGGHRIL